MHTSSIRSAGPPTLPSGAFPIAAGKSSLINAMKKLGGTGGKSEPTVAPVPGTTLGLLRVPGIPLGPKHRTFDTPGVPHSYQLTSRLNLDELAAVLPRRRLKPRTYRIPVGSSILIGGLARVDVISAPSATVYVTFFVSDEIVTHLGKTQGKRFATLLTTQFSCLTTPVGCHLRMQLPYVASSWSRQSYFLMVAHDVAASAITTGARARHIKCC